MLCRYRERSACLEQLDSNTLSEVVSYLQAWEVRPTTPALTSPPLSPPNAAAFPQNLLTGGASGVDMPAPALSAQLPLVRADLQASPRRPARRRRRQQHRTGPGQQAQLGT
jgi:hypothetical protein